jgi:hypothetical protein
MKTSFIIYCLFTFSFGYAQNFDLEKFELTGNLFADSRMISDEYDLPAPVFVLDDIPDKKSPVLAGVMSAVLPGSGELYVGEYLKAAIFFAVEAALMTVAVVNNNEGDDLTAKFEAFADENWSVVKYAEYLKDHKTELGLPDDCNIENLINPDESLPPWERIYDWNGLNYCESMVTASGFTHHLPPYGAQQYYELIGKYKQYSPGWKGFSGNSHHDVPQIMKDYSVMRGEANDAYNVASKAVIGIYINHILSAIDAVWSASNYNKNLAVKMRVENVQVADRFELVPTLNLRYNF